MAWKITEIPDEAPGGNGCGTAIGVIIVIIVILVMLANS